MSRKVVLSISAALIVLEIGVSATLLKSAERHLAASLTGVATIVALVREYSHPIPKLDKFL